MAELTSLASPELLVGLNAAILAVTQDEPRVLTLSEAGAEESALPFGPLDPSRDRTLELALRGWVREQTGLELGYVEQLYTFGDRDRHLDGARPARVLSIGYLALVREGAAARGARWHSVYELLPWEDRRRETSRGVLQAIEKALRRWAAEADAAPERRRRGERIDIALGLAGAAWDADRVLERYELVYEAGLVGEAARDRGEAVDPELPTGRAMRSDHRRILATALGRLRGKVRYRPVVFELLPEAFTLLQLQRVVEALSGLRLHKQNFRRLVEKAGLVEGTGRRQTGGSGRPAELFRFRRDVLRERPAPGVGLPGRAEA